MINTPMIQTNARSSMSARDILSLKRWGTMGALALILLLGFGVLAGVSPVHAQEQKTATVPVAKSAAAHVNINTADAQTLAANLKGVGETRATEIVRYRETYGPFASADELMEVKGIGKSTLEMNRDVITLE
jgi:competence protein ComEA